jgi:HJR/Mrr/RecB family endonuclease
MLEKRRMLEERQVLEKRHRDTIESHLGSFDPMRQSIDAAARTCMERIAAAEGQRFFGSTNAEFYGSLLRADPEFSALHSSIRERFEGLAEGLTVLQNKYATLISQFYEVAERKVSLRDEYGDERWDALDKEVDVVIKKIAQKEGGRPLPNLATFLKQSFRERHKTEQQRPIKQVDFATMTGEEFEIYLMELLSRRGYTVYGTPATGDQGADLLAKKDGRTIVIQAKNYQGPVGNSAVQEVLAAVHFYAGDEGWVITNSTFTPAAKDLAQRAGVRLIDGHELAGW